MTEAPFNLGVGELENTVLNAVWDMEQSQGDKIYVGAVQAKIKTPQKKWAYTTIKTVLDRMVDKALLLREKDGKRFFYQSNINRDSAKEVALKKVLHQYFMNDVSKLEASIQLLERKR